MSLRPSRSATTPLHHASASHAASAAILHKGLDLRSLLRCEYSLRLEHRLHARLFHFCPQSASLVNLRHDRALIRVFSPHQFAQFNAVHFHLCARLHGRLFRVHADLVQLSNLFVGETESFAHHGIFRHAQHARAATKSAPAASLHTHSMPALAHTHPLSAELAPAASRKFARTATPLALLSTTTPLVLSAATHLMLALPRSGRLWGGILSPNNNRCRQQNHKT